MLLEKVRRTIEKYNLLENGDTVICAVSGGADSVCLLHLMQTLKYDYNLTVFVANVNHLIRGEESDRDSNFVKSVCKAADVKCFYREYDVKEIAKARKIGEEECGRILRYEFFDEISKELGGAKIATAHNLNDNAETVLFRMIRGSSAHGLSGISYKRENIIRPILDITRSEIEDYLVRNGISWCNDSTNALPVYARNKLRLKVFPELNSVVNNAEKRIVSAAKLIGEDDMYLCSLADTAISKCLFKNYFLLTEFNRYELPVKRRIISNLLSLWGMKEITADKIEDFIEYTEKESGKKFDINAESYAEKSYDRIYLRKREKAVTEEFTISGETSFTHEKFSLNVKISTTYPTKAGNNTAVFDADKLSFPLRIRFRKKGDRMKLKGMSGTKKISDIFSDEKIERIKRDFVPLILKEDEVIFLCGLRQSPSYATDYNTKKYLLIDYTEENV